MFFCWVLGTGLGLGLGWELLFEGKCGSEEEIRQGQGMMMLLEVVDVMFGGGGLGFFKGRKVKERW